MIVEVFHLDPSSRCALHLLDFAMILRNFEGGVESIQFSTYDLRPTRVALTTKLHAGYSPIAQQGRAGERWKSASSHTADVH
jgi:hypothetical protein